MTQIPDAVARGIRVFVQANILNALIAVLVSFGVPITHDQQEALLAFTAALAIFVTGYNALENGTNFPALLKAAPPAQNPVGETDAAAPDPAPDPAPVPTFKPVFPSANPAAASVSVSPLMAAPDRDPGHPSGRSRSHL